ncbi:hypothetical protein G6L89_023720 (plasmid) [Agrobacterium fabrum]|uniref:hypothetical protein n=1 Tax=Agrobacterium fabrum TaxID=1176649 RepID=UPI001572DD70|nr:hypothetical protein [Agrobacterium fabrum]NTB10655.1 hypothetical protein [Agrobacterium fabrum]
MQDFDAVEFADRLAAMTDEEVFGLMKKLEEASEIIRPEDRDDSDVFAQIGVVETVIEDRFPGQLMAPYKDWQQRRVGG